MYSLESEEINLLLKRQTIILEEVDNLINESKEITKKLSQISMNSIKNNRDTHIEKTSTKNQIKNFLENKGFNVSTKTMYGNKITIVSNNEKEIKTIIKQSKYYDSSPYQAWFTINSNSLDFIDIFIFIYIDNSGSEKSLVIESDVMAILSESISKMPDGRMNINLVLKDDKVIEYTSKINLTNHINDFSVF